MVELRGEFSKVDEDRRLAFGWASVVKEAGGTEGLEDLQGDVLDPDSLEQAVYEYVLVSRDADVMHKRDGVGRLVESMLFTPEKLDRMGLDPAAVPVGWWVGYRVDDDEVWKGVKDGTYRMFSIRGTGVREEINGQ